MLRSSAWTYVLAAALATVGGLASIELGALMGAAPEATKRVLIVADEFGPMQVLAEFLRAEGGFEVRIVDQKDMPADTAPYHAVFMYIHGPMQDATGKALAEYAERGGRLVLLHHAVASARRNNPEFLKFVGIAISPRDDPKTPWRVIEGIPYTLVNLQPRHYITTHGVRYDRTVEYQPSDTPSAAGKFPAIDLADTEAFLNQQFTDGRAKTVLLGFRVTDPKTGEVLMQDRAGWYKAAGKGWVFYFQPGHMAADFKNRNYARMILNCLTWQPGMQAPGD
jgi:type 1 glutamine amidotransferase